MIFIYRFPPNLLSINSISLLSNQHNDCKYIYIKGLQWRIVKMLNLICCLENVLLNCDVNQFDHPMYLRARIHPYIWCHWPLLFQQINTWNKGAIQKWDYFAVVPIPKYWLDICRFDFMGINAIVCNNNVCARRKFKRALLNISEVKSWE